MFPTFLFLKNRVNECEVTVKYAQFHVGMLEAERNIWVALKELNKLRVERASIEQDHTLSNEVSQLQADLASKSKELADKEKIVINIREELTTEVDRNAKLKHKMEKKMIDIERKGREAGQTKFMASNEYKALVAQHWLKRATGFKRL